MHLDEKVTALNIEKCDELVKGFGLDKKRDIYFNRSRMMPANQNGLTNLMTVPVDIKE